MQPSQRRKKTRKKVEQHDKKNYSRATKKRPSNEDSENPTQLRKKYNGSTFFTTTIDFELQQFYLWLYDIKIKNVYNTAHAKKVE
jgi:uncharacterized Rmd1/YagE family protein